jgi:hypothetical protein
MTSNLAARRGLVAPKPEPVRLAAVFGTLTSVFGIVLAVAAILVIVAWAAPPSPSAESIQPCQMIYQSQYLNLY